MRVLHYTLGLPPYRTGGLTTWSSDLMSKQVQLGIEVLLLYPGQIKLFNKKISIKHEGSHNGIELFNIINPLPVPLIYAIDSNEHYINYDKSADYTSFFEQYKIDTIHLHTLMGLPIEFLQQAKKAGINIMYTTHDTFGIWPEPNLGNVTDDIDPIFNFGYIGNQKTLKYCSIILAQSSVYRKFKNTYILKKAKGMLKQLRAILLKQDGTDKLIPLKNNSTYVQLRKVYHEFFRLIDTIHYNSDLTRDIFEKYGVSNKNFIAEVYHSKMSFRPKNILTINYETKKNIRMLYNGSSEQYKGFNLLVSVLDELYNEDINNFNLIVYGMSNKNRQYIESHNGYSINSISKVYSDIDVTIVPSLYYETFGMVVAESLSFGVPVIVSRTVGAKSLLLEKNYGYIFQSRKELKQYIKSLIIKPLKISLQKNAILTSKDLVFDSTITYGIIMQKYKIRKET